MDQGAIGIQRDKSLEFLSKYESYEYSSNYKPIYNIEK